ncbi:MAG TPA: ribosome small subunit-dependent GTPase A [Nocardioidaceae bacterium]|nr:ribosome small subunit-dependent GTPase A [Nocardioidaceae bacterium]
MAAPVVDLVALGWDDAWRESSLAHPDELVGRIAGVDRGLASILTEHGLIRASYGGAVLEAMATDPLASPCTGDWCLVRHWPDGPFVIETVLPRRTVLTRAEASRRSQGQVLAANMEVVAVVAGLHPEPNLGRLERMLSLAWDSGAQPLVVLTKADMVTDSRQFADDVAQIAPGVDVLCTSVVSGRGVDTLRSLLAGHLTVALMGASGHGKSSLANALVGADVLAARPIRGDGRGRHTTVRRELLMLPGGGAVVDTPGLRGVGLLSPAGSLGEVFPDVEELSRLCKFSNCTHDAEPGCAVAQAVDEGTLGSRRLSSWRLLQREQLRMAARTDLRLRAELTKQRKHLSKQAKAGRRHA